MVENITPAKTYLLVAAVLLVLTLGTIGVSFLPLGPFHTPAALAFAVAKAVLVALYFMHARYSARLTRLVIVVAIVWFGIFMVGTLDDYLTRSWLSAPGH